MVIFPNTYVDPSRLPKPLFFLAGPVQGGGNWQSKAYSMFRARLGVANFTAIIPFQPKSWGFPGEQILGDSPHFDKQLPWERFYLEQASRLGSILFYLPVQDSTYVSSRTHDYARDTRGELGEWRGRLMSDQTIKMVVGGEINFKGLDVIKRNFDAALSCDYHIYSNLEKTVIMAIEMASKLV